MQTRPFHSLMTLMLTRNSGRRSKRRRRRGRSNAGLPKWHFTETPNFAFSTCFLTSDRHYFLHRKNPTQNHKLGLGLSPKAWFLLLVFFVNMQRQILFLLELLREIDLVLMWKIFLPNGGKWPLSLC